ncbi:hypothetical protein ABPG72_014760 [Tetrahymena utriculariae]
MIRSNLISQTSACICQDRYYQSSDLTTCLKCHPTCLTCIDSSSNSCISCDISNNFIRSNTQIQTSQCICKDGYYLNNFQCNIDYCYVGCLDCDNQKRQCRKCQNKYQQNSATTECTLVQITEIQETYQTNNSTTYQKMQNVVVGSAILAVSSPGINFSKQFLTIQKLNFIFIIDITYNEYIYLFMQSIVGQNPLNKLQNINFLSNSWFEESQDSLNNQIFTKKIGQTSIIYNAGGVFACILICLSFSLPIIFIQQSSSQINRINQTYQPTGKEKIKGYYQAISLNAINIFNDLMCQIIFFAISLQIINFIHSKMQIQFFEYKILFIIIFGVYFIVTLIIYYSILNKQSNFTKSCFKDAPKTYSQAFYELLLNQKIEQNFISRNLKLIQMIIECLIIPVFIVIFYQSYQIQTLSCATVYLILFNLSIIYRPCQNLLDNIQLILESFLWLLSFCLLFALGIQTEKLFDNPLQKDSFLEIVNKISLSLIVIFVIILLLSPIIQIFKVIQMMPILIQKVKEYLEKKKEERKNKPDNQQKEDSIEDNLNFQDFANNKSVKYVNHKNILNMFIKKSGSNQFDNQLLQMKSVQISNDQLDQDQI